MFQKIFCLVLILLAQFSNATVSDQLGAKMKEKALIVLSQLSNAQKQKALFAFDAAEKTQWRYFPSPKAIGFLPDHTGLKLGELTTEQENIVLDLVALAVSPSGLDIIKAARAADSDPSVERSLVNKQFFLYGKENYSISFFGAPTDKLWMWRFEGHHVSINITIENDQVVSGSPNFLGAYPTQYVLDGKNIDVHSQTVKALASLLATMTPDQLVIAGQSLTAVPGDLLFTPGLKGEDRTPQGLLPTGLNFAQLQSEQRAALSNLALSYWGSYAKEISEPSIAKVFAAGVENVQFIFAGDPKLKELFYFRIQGPTFVFEFGTGDRQMNHYHVTWIDLK